MQAVLILYSHTLIMTTSASQSTQAIFMSQVTPNGQLAGIVQRVLDEIALPSPEQPDKPCLFTEIGEYLVHLARTFSAIAYRLVHGQHIEEYVRRAIRIEEEVTDLSEIEPIYSFDDDLSALCEVVTQAREASSNILNIWHRRRPTRHQTPVVHTVHVENSSSMSEMVTKYSTAFISCAGETETDTQVPPITTLADPTHLLVMNEADEAPQESLSRRGKGSYTCPYGVQCTKGGVADDGTLVILERNSAFRAHLQKHMKPFRCDLPGCKNTKGFARIDQLKRHKEIVTHNSGH
ncbi:hypothetical protein F5Y19DRAFT_451951 [Xylariaceae sp. FL1651]|nr:hypothetical protein F5Y19DRAFT_451951 [Xylariaceae sp. FL1651]